MAIGFTDHVAYQRLRNNDLIQQGFSLYDNQGIMFDGHVPVDILEKLHIHRQAVSQNQPLEDPDRNSSDNDGDDESGEGNRRPQQRKHGTHHECKVVVVG